MNFLQTTKEENKDTLKMRQELEQAIERALGKIKGDKYSDICRYLPDGGGYMHHFTLEKLRTKNPENLLNEIKKYILDAESPQEVPPKPRAARGSRSQQMRFTQGEIERLTRYSLKENDMELVAKLTSNQTLKALAQQLTKAILKGEATPEMWHVYYEVKKAQAHAKGGATSGTDSVEAALEAAIASTTVASRAANAKNTATGTRSGTTTGSASATTGSHTTTTRT